MVNLAPFLSGLSFVVAAGLIALGVWVALRERWSSLGLRLATLVTLSAAWMSCTGMVIAQVDGGRALVWARASYLFAALIPAALYQFTVSLLGRHREQEIPVALLWAIGLMVGGMSQATVGVGAGVWRYPWGYYVRLAPTAVVAVVIYLGVLLSVFGLLLEEIRSNEPERKQRAQAFCVAFSVGTLALIDYLPSFGWRVLPLGLLPIAASIVVLARALRPLRLHDGTVFAPDKILGTLQGAVMVVDLEERIRVANPAAAILLGYDADELVGLRLLDVIETPRNVGNASDTVMRGGTVRQRPMIWRRRDRSRVQVEVSVSMLRDTIGAPAGMVYVAGDIADRERAAQIEYQAFHDPLTGLPNRTAFSEHLESRLIARAGRGAKLAVLFLDLDGFKLINDSLGHSAGDRVLQVLAQRLRRTVREEDFVCRFGGDEFTLLLEMRSASHAEVVAHKLLAAVAEPLVVDGHPHYVTGSLGIALHPEDGEDPESLLRNADAAMYLAKDLGRNNYQLCGQGLSERARDRMSLEVKLRGALATNSFELHYQPILELATQMVVGVEALLRWHCDGELVLPDSFLRVAEETLLIRPIGDWALRSACAQGAAWQERFGDFRVAVNLSAHQLEQPGMVEQIAMLLDATGMPAQRLELEITESVAMKDPERTRDLLGRLKELGVRLALDDFGTGYSSLSYLQGFPLDTVKIDRSFVAGLGQARGGLAIIRATLAMATALGLRVTAEGVETPLQQELLTELGCHYGQGFGIGAPVPAEELEAIVQRAGRRRDTGERPILRLQPRNVN